MAKTQTRTALLSSQSLAAGGTVRSAVLDNTATDGGIITYRITNGATGPTLQCVARILIAHKQASVPTAAAQGTADTDWKVVREIGGGISNSVSTAMVFQFGPEIAYVYVEFTGNTAQAVTVEAHSTSYTY